MKHEETTQDPLLHGMHPEQDSEDRYPTSMSSEEAVPGIISATAKEHKNESMHTGTCQKSNNHLLLCTNNKFIVILIKDTILTSPPISRN